MRYIALSLAAVALSACAASEPTFGERVISEGSSVSQIGERWTRGDAMIAEGRALVERGEDRIDDGEDLIADGRKLRKRGERMVDEGQALKQDAEEDYRLREEPAS